MNILEALVEGLGVKQFGPDWREKRDAMEAETANTRARLPQIEAETQGVRTRNAAAELGMETTRQEQEKNALELEKMKKDRKELEALVASGAVPEGSLIAHDFAMKEKERELSRRKGEADIKHTEASTRSEDAQAGMYRQKASGGGGVDLTGSKWMTGPDGQQHLFDRHGRPIEELGGERFAPPPTADQRNMERFDVIIPTHLEAIQRALDTVKKKGSGVTSYMNPWGEGYMSRSNYSNLVNALAASAGRAMGDSRISDTDRAAYAKLYGIASQLVGLGPGTAMAQSRLDQARELFEATQASRKRNALPPGPAVDETPLSVSGGAINDTADVQGGASGIEEYRRNPQTGKLERVK